MPEWRGETPRPWKDSNFFLVLGLLSCGHMPAGDIFANEIERFFVGSDRRLDMDAGSGRRRSLAFSHERAVAADKRLVRITVRTRGVPASGRSVEKSGGNQRFRLATIRCRTAFLCRRAYRFANLASPNLSVCPGRQIEDQIVIFVSARRPFSGSALSVFPGGNMISRA